MANPFKNPARESLLKVLGVKSPIGNSSKIGTPSAQPAFTPVATVAADKRGNGSNSGGGGGRTCKQNNDCPKGKICTGGVCTEKNGSTTPVGTVPPVPQEQPVQQTPSDGGCGRNAPCPAGMKCKNKVCIPLKPGETPPPDGGGGGTGSCTSQSDCNYGESCVNGQCISPNATPGTVYEAIDANPQAYLQNLATRGGLNTRGGTVFGNFQNNVFADIQAQYESQGLNNPNVPFKTWLAAQRKYGNPNLTQVPGSMPIGPIEQPDARTMRSGNNGGGGGSGGTPECANDGECGAGQICGNNGKCKQPECTSNAECGANKACVNNRCAEDPTKPYYSQYEGVTPFANYLRNQYYGASSRDRGSDSAAYGAGSTRWSAF